MTTEDSQLDLNALHMLCDNAMRTIAVARTVLTTLHDKAAYTAHSDLACVELDNITTLANTVRTTTDTLISVLEPVIANVTVVEETVTTTRTDNVIAFPKVPKP